ncbi:imelysin family protein [Amphritea japonica]|uniref:Iron-regulated protein n=1 Tax=Amphritea japonica ATCC BAA-1530 TaxID=1278309 RepID=A0A7R6SQZ9_9GAMM|nr:imelysin family protein [Amphritea japonica]BBB24661.1 iron-regulated protein [Amphritea japonica ATCC BAA-1530]
MQFKTLLTSTILAGTCHYSVALYAAPAPAEIIKTYADIALATYEDSLNSAKDLQLSTNNLLENPTQASLDKARTAWIAARVPYQQSEVFRFGNLLVDDWEGRVNAWPLDEGLIDYVDSGYYGSESDENTLYRANVIANTSLRVGGVQIDASHITPEFLSDTLHEVDGIEANVATGYHAIEFLLWGQDLNGTSPGAGNRPATDFNLEHCTGGHCDRRRDYLQAATQLLITDLQEMVDNWKEGGEARQQISEKSEKHAIATILTGMGSLAYGELAGERTKLGLMLHDPEEEHDCFSDNTHWSHYYDAKGIRNVYQGSYTRIDGSTVSGPSLSDYVAAQAAVTNQNMLNKLQTTENAAQKLVDRAAQGETFDVLIGEGNTSGNLVVQNFVDALTEETRAIENIIALLHLEGIQLEGSDSLDNPAQVLE